MDKISELLRLVSDTIDRIETILSESAKWLRQNVFRVKLEESEVKVSNQAEVTEAVDKINELITKISKQKHLVQVDNQITIPEKLNVTVLNPIKEVRVSNPPSIPDTVTINNLNELTGLLQSLLAKLSSPLTLDHTDPEKKLAVRLVDGEDRFYDAVFRGSNSTGVVSSVDRLAPLLTQIRQAVENIDINIDVGELTVVMDDLEKLAGIILVHSFNQLSNQVANVEVELTSVIVPAGRKYRVKQVYGESDNDCVYSLYINGALKWRNRNAWTDRNIHGIVEVDALPLQTIQLKVEPKRNSVDLSGGFYAYDIG